MLCGEKTKGTTDFDVYGFLNGSDTLTDLIYFCIAQGSAGGDDRVTQDAAVGIIFCLFYNFLGVEKRILLGTGVIVSGLGTELAVLGALATFTIDDGADIEGVLTKVLSDFVGAFAEFLEVFLRCVV